MFKKVGKSREILVSLSRYAELLQPLATSVAELYPGWRMRIYHNVTEEVREQKFYNRQEKRDLVDLPASEYNL